MDRYQRTEMGNTIRWLRKSGLTYSQIQELFEIVWTREMFLEQVGEPLKKDGA